MVGARIKSEIPVRKEKTFHKNVVGVYKVLGGLNIRPSSAVEVESPVMSKTCQWS